MAIFYASKAHINYTTTEKELLAVVYALEKFWSYILGSKIAIYTDPAASKYLLQERGQTTIDTMRAAPRIRHHLELRSLVCDVSFSCVVKTQRRSSNKIYKTELTKIRYNNQVLCKYRVDPHRARLTLIVELTWSNLGLKGVLDKIK